MELDFTVSEKAMNVVDVKPLHNTFGLTDARLIRPQHPEQSVLLHRMAIRGRGQMPQLATDVVDQQAVDLIRRWILEMKPSP